MKKWIFLFMMIAAMCISLCSCSNSEKTGEKSNVEVSENAHPENTGNSSSAEPKPTPTPTPQMIGEELDALLLEQPMYVESTKYVVQDPKYKSLYPDMLQAVIKNSSGTDIKNVQVAFAAWDSNGFPVKIVGQHDFSGGYYVQICNYDDVNMVDGSTYGRDSGMALDSDTDNIAEFKAIVITYEDFDGNTWDNPYYDTWLKMYEDKRLNK